MAKKSIGTKAKKIYSTLKKVAPKGAKVIGPKGVGNYTVGKTPKKSALSKVRAGLNSSKKK